jgi:hypothetical protein
MRLLQGLGSGSDELGADSLLHCSVLECPNYAHVGFCVDVKNQRKERKRGGKILTKRVSKKAPGKK